MASVGIVPTHVLGVVGSRFKMAGQIFTNGTEATREEFYQAVESAGLHRGIEFNTFQRIYTD